MMATGAPVTDARYRARREVRWREGGAAWWYDEVMLPESVTRLLWDVDPAAIDVEPDRALIMERVMSRGTWEAMCWLRATYSQAQLAEFVLGRGARVLSPRDLSYWALMADVQVPSQAGGGRPRWLGR